MDPPAQAAGNDDRPSPVAMLFVFIMMLMYVSPSGNDTQLGTQMTAGEYLNLKLARETNALNVLNTTRWGDFSPSNDLNVTLAGGGVGSGYLNITGYRQDDGFSWARMKKVQQRFDVFRKSYGPPDGSDEKAAAQYAVYHNATGLAAGPWIRSQGLGFENQLRGGRNLNISHINSDTNWAWGVLNKNITGTEGSATLHTLRFDPHSTVSDGRIKLKEREKNQPRMAEASLTLRDESNYGGWELRLYGFHWPESGLMALTTSSDKFDGIYGLPHLMSTASLFNSSQQLLNETLGEILAYRKRQLGPRYSDFWSEDSMINPSPHCEFVVFVQVHAITQSQLSSSSDSLQDQVIKLEHELRHPDGLPHLTPPPLRMSFVAFSPDCDSIIESKGPPSYVPAEGQHLKGYKGEVYISKLKTLLILAAGVMFVQAFLLLQQSKDASTPSTTSRVSVYTIALMMFVDFVVEFGTMMTGAAADAVYPMIYITAFASLSGLLLGGRFLGEIYRFQAPERQERQRARARAQAIREAPATAARAEYWNRRAQLGLPIPQVILEQGIITADGVHIPIQQPARPLAQDAVQADDQPIIVPSDQDVDAEIAENDPAAANAAAGLPAPNTATPAPARRIGSATLDYMSMFAPAFMLATLFFLVTISSLTWPPFYRAFYLNTLGTCYLGMWWPQIFRNVKMNYRKALNKKFVIGMSACRLLPFAYIFCYEDNLAFAEPNYLTFLGLAAWVWIQIVILAAQEIVGARLGLGDFLGKFMDLPETWDYHPILHEDDVEGGGMPIGLVLSSGNTSPALSRSNTHDGSQRKKNDAGHHSRTVDCAICQNILEVPVMAATTTGDGVASAVASATRAGALQGMLEKRKYMVTPCRHVFHSECLEGWMRHKLMCPSCRADLPPL